MDNLLKRKKGPIVDPGVCRCCGASKRCRVLNVEYDYLDRKEVYTDLFVECFGLLFSNLDGEFPTRLICATCVSRLRGASLFKKQVLEWERKLLHSQIIVHDEVPTPKVDLIWGSMEIQRPESVHIDVNNDHIKNVESLKPSKVDLIWGPTEIKKPESVPKDFNNDEMVHVPTLKTELKWGTTEIKKPEPDPKDLNTVMENDVLKKPRQRVVKNAKEIGKLRSLYREYRKTSEKFFDFARINMDTFDYILLNIEDDIQMQIKCKRAVKAEEKLLLTLRYLGTGESLKSLSQSFNLGRSTVAKSIYQTLKAIWKNLADLHMPQPTTERLQNVANDYYSKWQYPNCYGAIGAKYYRIVHPSYDRDTRKKKFFSLVLHGISDTDNKFVAIEVATRDKKSDDTFHFTHLNTLLEENKFNAPSPKTLPGSDIILPFVLLGDEAYPLKYFLMRPYPALNLNEGKKVFNHRLSKARVTIDCAFGILESKFPKLSDSIETNIKHAKLMLQVSCLIHNIVRDKDGLKDEHFRQFLENYKQPEKKARSKTRSMRNNRATATATLIRDQFQTYFINYSVSKE